MLSSKHAVLGFVGWSLAVAIAGCGPGQPGDEDADTDEGEVEARGCSDEMVDSTQLEYVTIAHGDCTPGPLSEPLQAFPHVEGCAPAPPLTLRKLDRFYSLCLLCDEFDVAQNCRPLVCEVDEDCPWYDSKDRFECRGGLCQSADLDAFPPDRLSPDDAETLCNAPLERGVAYEGPDPCPGVEPSGTCPHPLPDVCLQP